MSVPPRHRAALRYLGLASGPTRPRVARTAPPAAPRLRAPAAAATGGPVPGPGVLVYLGLATAPPRRRPAPAGPSPRRAGRPPRGPSSRAPGPSRPPLTPRRLLEVIGLAERPIRVTGHPRLRQRAVEAIQSRRRRERVLTGSVGLLLGLVLLSWGVLRSPLLAVESVSVVGVGGEAVESVRAAARVVPGGNVLDVDLDATRDKVGALPWVEQVTVRRRLPSTVEVRVAARTAVLAGTAEGRAYMIDADGVVIGTAEAVPADLPTMPLDVAPSTGQVMAAGPVADAASVASGIPPGLRDWVVGYRGAQGGQVDMEMRVPTPQGPVDLVVHLGRPVDVDVKARTLASLLAETVGQGMRPRGLDVRIPDRPVVLT